MSEFDIMVFFGIRALVALIAGFILGIERSLSNHYVGVKAIVFVCIGSCLFASLSFYLYSVYPHTDPTRIIGQAITGIGFLGAVLHNNTSKASGLTSSAIIWTACGLGLMAGSGLFWIPIFAAITLVIITIVLKKLEKFLEKYEKDNTEEKTTKMAIVVRSDLRNIKGEKVRSGKIASQVGHSVLGFVWNNVKGKKICFEMSDAQYDWYNSGQTKITLKVEGEKALLEIFQRAKDAGVFVELITDAGRTEFGEPTKTCLAIGPDYSDKIDKITGGLSLY